VPGALRMAGRGRPKGKGGWRTNPPHWFIPSDGAFPLSPRGVYRMACTSCDRAKALGLLIGEPADEWASLYVFLVHPRSPPRGISPAAFAAQGF
jgi:hypothetical protein